MSRLSFDVFEKICVKANRKAYNLVVKELDKMDSMCNFAHFCFEDKDKEYRFVNIYTNSRLQYAILVRDRYGIVPADGIWELGAVFCRDSAALRRKLEMINDDTEMLYYVVFKTIQRREHMLTFR